MWRIRYSSGMTSDTPPWSPTKERTSRPDAEKALINAVITLVDTAPIADITVHQLAHEAGVNFGYVNRYFESRLNLFAAATDELADRGIAFLQNTAVKQPIIQRNGMNDLSDTDLQKTRDHIIPIGVKQKSQAVLEAAVEVTTSAGLDPVIARARVVHGIAMMWGAATLSPILGLTPQDLNDAYTTFFADVISNKR
jgi:AcrR family transcriptional regulator